MNRVVFVTVLLAGTICFGQSTTRPAKPQVASVRKHETLMQLRSKPTDLLFIGDDLMSGWDDGFGQKVWGSRFEKYKAANFGVRADKTQHVLWRIGEGELDGMNPKIVIVMIGSNNISDSADDMTAGIKAVVSQIHEKLPNSTVMLLGIFPRRMKEDANTAKINDKLRQVNTELAKLDDGKKTRFLEIWKPLLDSEGKVPKDVMYDGLNLTEKGYTIWTDAMQPLLEELMK